MNQESYTNVLSQHYIPWAQGVYQNEGNDFMLFQEDNASCHAGAYAK